MRAGRVVAAVCLVLGLAALATLDPAAVGLSTTAAVAHVVAFRALAALGMGVAALVVAGVALARRGRPGGLPAALLAAALVVTAAGHGAVQVARGTPDEGAGGRAPVADVPAAASSDLVVLTLNVQVDGATAREVAAAAARAGADVLALLEASADLAAATADELEVLTGARPAVFTDAAGASPVASTNLLVSPDLGSYREVAAPALQLGAVRVEPAGGDGPVLAAVHPPPPLPVAIGMARWSEQARSAARLCAASPASVVAGDLNATLDHAPLRDLGPCVDAARQVGAAHLGTWPASLPAPLASPIDHVLVDARSWSVTDVAVQRIGSGDHRAVLARLARR